MAPQLLPSPSLQDHIPHCKWQCVSLPGKPNPTGDRGTMVPRREACGILGSLECVLKGGLGKLEDYGKDTELPTTCPGSSETERKSWSFLLGRPSWATCLPPSGGLCIRASSHKPGPSPTPEPSGQTPSLPAIPSPSPQTELTGQQTNSGQPWAQCATWPHCQGTQKPNIRC